MGTKIDPKALGSFLGRLAVMVANPDELEDTKRKVRRAAHETCHRAIDVIEVPGELKDALRRPLDPRGE